MTELFVALTDVFLCLVLFIGLCWLVVRPKRREKQPEWVFIPRDFVSFPDPEQDYRNRVGPMMWKSKAAHRGDAPFTWSHKPLYEDDLLVGWYVK